MSPLAQYGLLFAFAVSTIGLVLVIMRLGRAFGSALEETAKDTPFAGGTLESRPAWIRYHARYYGLALLLLAFDMEMAFMYPWATVYRELGLTALLDMGVFLAILFLGILYGWSQGALRRQ